MKSWFSQRGYPQKLIETETSKVKFPGRKVFHRTKVEKGVLLVVTYHPLLKTIGKIIHDNLYLLHMNEELKHLLTPGPCNKCRKQYVGHTVDTFRYRWNNYRSNSCKHVHGISCMQEHLHEHFCDSEHSGFLNDLSITFIDKTDLTNPLQRENYWKHTLKTFAPYGLNIKENK